MGKRRVGRELALQTLFEMEMGGLDQDAALTHVLGLEQADLFGWDAAAQKAAANPQVQRFAREEVAGVWEHLEAIDDQIAQRATHWTLSRIARVDRMILRMAIFEIQYCPDIPATVAINEAVELAKRYAGEDSGRFVNGVLGGLVGTEAQ